MSTGKWREEGVPHKGWTCVDVTDLGPDEEDRGTCEMCEVAEIRFSHTMVHPEYEGELAVGCICASHMEGDYVGPRERERPLRRRARRRLAWGKRLWSQGGAGVTQTRTRGTDVTVFWDDHLSGWRIRLVKAGRVVQGQKVYPAAADARRAAFDAVLWL